MQTGSGAADISDMKSWHKGPQWDTQIRCRAFSSRRTAAFHRLAAVNVSCRSIRLLTRPHAGHWTRAAGGIMYHDIQGSYSQHYCVIFWDFYCTTRPRTNKRTTPKKHLFSLWGKCHCILKDKRVIFDQIKIKQTNKNVLHKKTDFETIPLLI